jgi:hypothetical protein
MLAVLLMPGLAAAEGKAAPAGPTVIAVVGDSLADGMWAGLYKLLQKDKRFALVRGSKHSVGFTGSDLIDMLDKATTGEVHAVVMMVGTNDRRSFFVDGKSKALLGSPGWIELYAARVANFMDHVGRRKIPLVWVLLPVMREAQATTDAELVNEIVREIGGARSHVALIETKDFTGDEKGAYLSHFNDLAGQKKQMRATDGVHFEQAGYELIGTMILKRLREVSPRFQVLAAP